MCIGSRKVTEQIILFQKYKHETEQCISMIGQNLCNTLKINNCCHPLSDSINKTHTNHFTALLDLVRGYPGEPAPER